MAVGITYSEHIIFVKQQTIVSEIIFSVGWKTISSQIRTAGNIKDRSSLKVHFCPWEKNSLKKKISQRSEHWYSWNILMEESSRPIKKHVQNKRSTCSNFGCCFSVSPYTSQTIQRTREPSLVGWKHAHVQSHICLLLPHTHSHTAPMAKVQ